VSSRKRGGRGTGQEHLESTLKRTTGVLNEKGHCHLGGNLTEEEDGGVLKGKRI